LPVEKITISRNDNVHHHAPDIARTKSGRLICVYRESDSHVANNFSHIVYRISDDDGHTWSDRRPLIESFIHNGVLLKWNCPRSEEGSVQRNAHIYFWWSEDDGESWSKPQKTPLRGIVPDKLLETKSGAWLLATHWTTYRFGKWRAGSQMVYRSPDEGETWEGPFIICTASTLEPCEASIIQLPDGELICYMRENSRRGISALKSFSSDDGKTWEGPYETLMDACHRPVAGLLASGRVLITYRHYPGGAGYWAKNLFAYLETIESAKERDRMKQRGIILPIDHDRSERSDGGYSGWVQLSSGEIFAVNYIVDDAPKAQIRGYYFAEEDF